MSAHDTQTPYWMEAVDAVVDAGMIPVRLPGGLVGARPMHWADRFTPDERSDLVRVCVRLKHLVADKEGDAPRELWQAAHTTLREIMDFIDARGEQS